MILAIDIGNSQTAVGAFDGSREAVFVSRMATDTNRTRDEFAALLMQLMRLHGFGPERAEGVSVSSVVPPLTRVICSALKEYWGLDPLTVGPGIKTGLDIKIDSPSQLGADFVASAAGALDEFEPPFIIFDLGTATKGSAVNGRREFLGAVIAPGVGISLDALSERTAQLPHIGLQKPGRVIGRSTVESMRSGVLYGTAAMLDGLAARMMEELGGSCPVILTGGFSPMVCGLCECRPLLREHLILTGLLALYERNRQ